MDKFSPKVLALVLVLSLSMVGPGFADEVTDLKNQITVLSSKLNSLEEQMKGLAARTPGKPAIEHEGHKIPTGTEEGGLLHLSQDVTMGGYVDVQWNNNFRQPHTGSAATAATTPLRVFDANDGTFAVNAAELNFEKAAEEAGEAGFRVDLAFGQDSTVVNADGDGDTVNLQQAYVEYVAPLSFFEGSDILPEKIKLKAGRFVTLAGLEVIEGPDNWNISRSMMFGFAIPFAHTGIRSNFSLFNDFFDVYLGLNNGWDNPVDNNSFKTLETGLGYNLLDNLSMFHALYWGAEVPGTNAGKRWVLTNVATLDVTDKLSFMGEFDYGSQHNIQDPVATLPQTNDADWWGVAAYARYQLTDKAALSYRAEVFVDDALARTGLSDRTFGQTITGEYKLTENLITRAEFRHDKSNDDDIFAGDHQSQTSIGAQVIYLI